MFGTALRLLAVGEAGRRVGDYVQNLVTKYLVLSVAGTAFLGAIVFAVLAVFWAILSRNHDPVASAGIMSGILALVGFSIVFIAYGITREKPQSARQALRNPAEAMTAQVPAIDEVGRQIEHAAQQYGAVRVTAAAAAAGIIAGMAAKKFRQI